MLMNRDWLKLLSLFNTYNIRYMIVGGHAVIRYTEPRATKDLDIWPATDMVNAQALYDALKKFGAPLTSLTPKDFSGPGHFYQMGRPPLRVDISFSLPHVGFEDAWMRREEELVSGITIPFISKQDLIEAKKARGLPHDLVDLKHLTKEFGLERSNPNQEDPQ